MGDVVLLVDDEAAVLRTHVRLLAPLCAVTQPGDVPALRIQIAGSGMEAETFLTEYPECAVVVSDLSMPDMDGLTLLQRVPGPWRPMRSAFC